jgi:Ca2+-binding RTX toxin-like protein
MPIFVSQNWTIPAGSVLNYGYDNSDPHPTRIEFGIVNWSDTPPSLYNDGELRFYDTAVRMSTNYFYSFLSFHASTTWNGAIIENDGLISAIAPNTLNVLTIYAPSWGPSLYNSGTVEAVGAILATAYLNASSSFGANAKSVTNTSTGLITASAAFGALGVSLYNGGTLDNAGTIRATSTDATQSLGTVAVQFDYGRATVHNTGLLEAIDAYFDPLIARSSGIAYAGQDMGPIINDGVIRGDYAIFEKSFSGADLSVSAAVNITNNGLLDGNVFLALGNDVFLNNGEIIGWVDMGGDTDTYDGRLGTITGDLHGGDGNDTLRTGAGDNTLYGDAGNDILAGGVGADHLDGGAGSDTASYEDSPSAVTINLQAGTNAGADATGDTFASIENVTGSAFNDVLIGDANANTLSGLASNDTLAGSGGDDTLNGGAGVDSFDGGADYDRISFYALNAMQGASADLTTQTIANDGFGNAETMTGIESFGLATSFADNLNGNHQANEFFVGTGDQAYGQGGDDTFWIAGVPLLASGGDGVDTINFAADSGKLIADSNGDGLAEIVAQTRGIIVDIASGTISEDGFGGSSGAGAFLEFERIVGTRFADTISGDSNATEIYGGDGNDTLSGGGGDDTIIGDAGNDTLVGDAGADTLQGGDGADTLRGGAGADTIQGGGGFFDTATYDTSASGVAVDLQNQTATGGDAEGDVLGTIESVTGSAFADTLYGDSARNVLTGGAGNDFLDGRGEGDTLHGGDGDDLLIGSTGDAGNDLNGGDGFDTVSYANSTAPIVVQSPTAVRVGHNSVSSVFDSLSSIEKIIGSSFDDTMFGDGGSNLFSGGGGSDIINAYAGSDVLDGDAGDDYLFGSDGDDTLRGGDGNDWLDGGAGADLLDGGAGTDDLARYDESSSGVSVDLLASTASGGHATGDTITGIESVSGSSFNDQLSGDANANRLLGNGGADLFRLFAGGDDTALGGDGNDSFILGGSLTSADTIDGGAGTDTVNLDSNYPSLVLGASTITNVESLWLSAGSNYNITSHNGTVAAGQLLTVLATSLGAGNNVVFNGVAELDGRFSLNGGAGNDTFTGGALNDTISGNGGSDTVSYATSTANLTVNLTSGSASGTGIGTDTLSNVENVTTGSGNDTLTGSASDNVFSSGGGNDTLLMYSVGNDTVIAGEGSDQILFGGSFTATDMVDGGSGSDTLNLDGTYAGLVLGATSLTNVENIWLSSGKNYSLTTNNANVAAGQVLTVYASSLAAANTVMFDGSAELDGRFDLRGGAGNDTLIGGALNDNLDGGAGNDTLAGNGGADIFRLYGGGNDIASGGDANDTFLIGGSLNASDTIDGGTGADTVNLDGTYAGLVLGATTLTNVENLWLSSGWNYNITAHDGTVAAGQVLTVYGSSLSAANNVVFDGSADTDGRFDLRGGAGNDTLIGGALNDNLDGGAGNDTLTGNNGADILRLNGGGNDTASGGDGNDSFLVGGALTAADTINGGAGIDTVNLDGNYAALILGSLTVTNIENLWLTSGKSYNITSDDGTVAAGQTLNVLGQTLGSGNSVVFNGSAETNGAFAMQGGAGSDTLTGGTGNDVLTGNAGADILTGNAGVDRFVYTGVTQSTSSTYDTINGYVAASDLIDLNVVVTAIDAAISSGTLSTATFDVDLATAVNSLSLAAQRALLFTADAGTLAGQTFLVVDANGIAGYQANADYVINFASADLSGFGTGGFI